MGIILVKMILSDLKIIMVVLNDVDWKVLPLVFVMRLLPFP